MKLITENCGSAVYCEARGVMLAKAPDSSRRLATWRPGKKVPADAAKIADAGDGYKVVAMRFGWTIRTEAEINEACAKYA